MTAKQQKAWISLLSGAVGAAVAVLTYYGVQTASARSEGEGSGRAIARIDQHDRDIDRVEKRLETLEGRILVQLSDVAQKLARIEGKLEGK